MSQPRSHQVRLKQTKLVQLTRRGHLSRRSDRNFTFSSFLIRNKHSTEESELASMHTSTSCHSDRIRLVVDSIYDRTVATTELGPIGGEESIENANYKHDRSAGFMLSAEGTGGGGVALYLRWAEISIFDNTDGFALFVKSA